ncbi:MAG: hypothetical protein H7Z10_02390 [Gemmatimonadaceae bacterium]|nr:hypothetical protein [Acetobacteraceae bacterium]
MDVHPKNVRREAASRVYAEQHQPTALQTRSTRKGWEDYHLQVDPALKQGQESNEGIGRWADYGWRFGRWHGDKAIRRLIGLGAICAETSHAC